MFPWFINKEIIFFTDKASLKELRLLKKEFNQRIIPKILHSHVLKDPICYNVEYYAIFLREYGQYIKNLLIPDYKLLDDLVGKGLCSKDIFPQVQLIDFPETEYSRISYSESEAFLERWVPPFWNWIVSNISQ